MQAHTRTQLQRLSANNWRFFSDTPINTPLIPINTLNTLFQCMLKHMSFSAQHCTDGNLMPYGEAMTFINQLTFSSHLSQRCFLKNLLLVIWSIELCALATVTGATTPQCRTIADLERLPYSPRYTTRGICLTFFLFFWKKITIYG